MVPRTLVCLFCLVLSLQATTLAETNTENAQANAFSDMLAVLRLSVADRQVSPDLLARHLTKVVDPAAKSGDLRERLSSAFASLVQLRSIQDATWTDAQSCPALSASSGLSLSLKIDRSRLLSDLAVVVDSGAGAGVFNDVLENIACDPKGPRVDIEKDLLTYVGDRCVLLNDQSSPGFRWLIAISVNDSKQVTKAIRRIVDASPDAQQKGNDHYQFGANGIAVTQEWLLFGNGALISETLTKL